MPADTDQQMLLACLSLLGEMQRRGAHFSQQTDQDPEVADAREYVAQHFEEMPEQELTQLTADLPLAGDFAGRWIHGPHAYGDETRSLLVLQLRWDFTLQPKCLSLVVGLIARSAEMLTRHKLLPLTAYRFENGEPGTTHDYDHAQPTTEVGRPPRTAMHGASSVLNQTSPAFPLDAQGPLGITACAVMAVLGSRSFGRLLVNPELAAAVRPFLGQLPIYSQRFLVAQGQPAPP